MDALFFGLGGLLLIAFFAFLPVWLLVTVVHLRRKLALADARATSFELKLEYLYKQQRAFETRLGEKTEAPPIPSPAPEATAPLETAAAPLETTAEPVPPAATGPQVVPNVPEAAEPITAAAPAAQVVPEPAAKPKPPAPKLEEQLATLFTRAGAGAVLLGLLYFFKYAVDNEWIGPMGRVLIGVMLGAGLIVTAEFLKKSTRAAYVFALIGLGLAALFVSIYAASAFYALLSTEAAFGGIVLVLLSGAALADRHRAEPILVLVLLAAFANPVLLSTGVDRPFALFAYLLFATAVAGAVAVRHQFRYAIGLAILATWALAFGWYDRFFETHQKPTWDGGARGAYATLGARAVPLGFVFAFGGLWTTFGAFLRRGGAVPHFSFAPVLTALVFIHLGATALLYDQPVPLGLTMLVAAIFAIGVLRLFARTEWLLLPMLVAFACLVPLTGEQRSQSQNRLLALLGGWTALYAAAFLAQRRERGSLQLDRRTALSLLAGLFAFELLASLLLLSTSRSALHAGITFGFGLAVLALIALSELAICAPILLAIQVLLLGTGLSQQPPGPPDPVLLAIFFAWTLTYVLAQLHAVTVLGRHGKIELISLVLAPLSFLALALAEVPSTAMPTLCAILTAAAGLLAFGPALWVERRRPALTDFVAVPAGLALVLFASALGFGLSGPSVTLLWGLTAALIAVIQTRRREPFWRWPFFVLLTMTLLHLFLYDHALAEAEQLRYLYSRGREGVYRFTPFLNSRCYAFLGTGAILGFIGHRASNTSARLRGALVVGGYALAVGILIFELRSFVLTLPPAPPIPLDGPEFSAFLALVDEARFAQRGKLELTTTIALGAFGAAFTLLGFAFKHSFHRYLGLAVLGATLLKLVMYDIWSLQKTHQIVALTAVGLLLLGAGFLYARLRHRFALLLPLLFLPVSARAEPDPITALERRRPILGIDHAGDFEIAIGLDLYRESLSEERLADLRISDPAGHLVPYFVSHRQRAAPPPWRALRMFDPGRTEEGHFRATFEVLVPAPHCRIALTLAGAEPYIRRTRIESGPAPEDWTRIAEGGVVYSLPPDATGRELSYPASTNRYLRITLLHPPGESAIEIQDGQVTCASESSAPPPLERLPLQLGPPTHQDGITTLELDAGGEGAPIEALEFEIEDRAFLRPVTISASSYREVWPRITATVLYRVENGEGERLSLELPTPSAKRWFRVAFQDGDDAPLRVRAVHGLWEKRKLVVRAPKQGARWLYVGGKTVVAPTYDLERVLDPSAQRKPAELGPAETNPDFGRVDPALPWTERHRKPIGLALALVLVALAGWAFLVVRRSPPAGD